MIVVFFSVFGLLLWILLVGIFVFFDGVLIVFLWDLFIVVVFLLGCRVFLIKMVFDIVIVFERLVWNGVG